MAEAFVESISDSSRAQLAGKWGVSCASLQALGVGFDESDATYTFPVRDESGNVTGIRKRRYNDLTSKFYVDGSVAGLFNPDGVTAANAQIITEGESDLAAALTLGYGAIAAPGAMMHMAQQLAAKLIGPCVSACPCVIFDNDTGGLPGAGAMSEKLLSAGIPHRVLTPPEKFDGHDVTDLRDWLRAGLTTEELGKRIEAEAIRYPPGWAPGFAQIPNALVRGGLLQRLRPFAEKHHASPQSAWMQFSVICGYVGGNGIARVTREELAGHMGCDVRQVSRNNAALKGAGLLTWRQGRTKVANEYCPHFGPNTSARKRPFRVEPTWRPSPDRRAKKKTKGA